MTSCQPRRLFVKRASGPAISRSYAVETLSIRSPASPANIRRSSRSVYAPDGLAHGPVGVRRVMEHAPRIDPVEALVLERQCLRVGDAKVGLEPFELEPPPDEPDGTLGEVDACRIGARADKADEVGAEPDPYLEHTQPASALEVGKTRDVGLELVPPLLDLGVELRCALGRLGVDLAAGLPLPVRLDPLLVFHHGHGPY